MPAKKKYKLDNNTLYFLFISVQSYKQNRRRTLENGKFFEFVFYFAYNFEQPGAILLSTVLFYA